MSNFRNFLKNNIVLLDGAMGTMLLNCGLKAGELPERLNISNSSTIIDIHKAYYDAGSNVVCANTFGANSLKFNKDELDKIIESAVSNAKTARDNSFSKQEKFIALDIGPTGRMLKPFGDLDFEEAVNVFKTTVKLGVKYGVDLIIVETMNDGYETKAAVLACKECSDLPILVSNVYGKDGLLISGADSKSMVATLEGLNVDGLGANCSLGPKDHFPVIADMLEISSTPILFKPNAGLPKIVNGRTIYDVFSEEFANDVFEKVKRGVRIVGGCCGTTPEYIKALNSKIEGFNPLPIKEKEITLISSYAKVVDFTSPVIIGERINPTGKKRLKQAIVENDMGYILEEAVNQQNGGANVLDVNVGVPGIDETSCLVNTIKEIQSVVDLPIQIDTSSSIALSNALRIYNGKALINSVNGKKESMQTVFPIAKKYGGVIVCLTLDENGIPNTVKGRFLIAQKIENEAKKYGISKKNLIFVALTLSVASDENASKITLDTLKELNKNGYKTVLGISNVSFGLPSREILNASFFSSALTCGLSSAIINPLSEDMMKAYYSFCTLYGYDKNFEKYISFATGVNLKDKTEILENLSLQDCIKNGFKEQAKAITEKLIKTISSIEIINGQIIPALDEVGKLYENKKIYLPQLLISAESAKTSFEVLKKNSVKVESQKCKIVLATVKGDIHDIGKNIVKMMLENYGFNVIDLGKDVEPELIVCVIEREKAEICGLSALMTTTVCNMENTIKLIKERTPWCKTVVGGAVLNEEYAKKIGADKYAKDAMETVRFAEKINN